MNILSFFGGIWSKVAGGLALLVGVLLLRGKYQSNKIGKLEHENKTITKKSKIQTEDAEFKARVMAAEQEEILKSVDEGRSKSKIDRLNGM